MFKNLAVLSLVFVCCLTASVDVIVYSDTTCTTQSAAQELTVSQCYYVTGLGSVDISSASSSSIEAVIYSDSACKTDATSQGLSVGSCNILNGTSSYKFTYSHAMVYKFSIFAVSFLLLSFII